jgi:hypothetical protein
MPSLRPKRVKAEPSAPAIEAAVCVEEFRPATVAPLIERWQRLPLDHPTVRAYPEFFRGLIRLDQEVNHDGS